MLKLHWLISVVGKYKASFQTESCLSSQSPKELIWQINYGKYKKEDWGGLGAV